MLDRDHSSDHDLSDHEMNLWAARFMGWHEVPFSGPNPKSGEFTAHNESVWRGPRLDWEVTPQPWSPVNDPAQAVLLMAEAAHRGITISSTLEFHRGWERFCGLIIDAPHDATTADLIVLWCRLVVLSIYSRDQEQHTRLPEIIYA